MFSPLRQPARKNFITQRTSRRRASRKTVHGLGEALRLLGFVATDGPRTNQITDVCIPIGCARQDHIKEISVPNWTEIIDGVLARMMSIAF